MSGPNGKGSDRTPADIGFAMAAAVRNDSAPAAVHQPGLISTARKTHGTGTSMPTDFISYPDIPAKSRKRCPLAADPRPECYCFEMNSSDIPDMQRFCGHNHRECRIYRAFLRACAQGQLSRDFTEVTDSPELQNRT